MVFLQLKKFDAAIMMLGKIKKLNSIFKYMILLIYFNRIKRLKIPNDRQILKIG